MRPKGTAKQLEARRRKAIAMKRQGQRTCDVARFFKIAERTVSVWWTAYQKKGDAALAVKPHEGKSGRLTEREKKTLVTALAKPPKAHGLDGERWTYPRIAELIKKRHDVDYHVDHIPRLMASLGWRR
jgi:transposase